MALQETAEVYLVSLFEDTNLAIIHAKCVTNFYLYFPLIPCRLLVVSAAGQPKDPSFACLCDELS